MDLRAPSQLNRFRSYIPENEHYNNLDYYSQFPNNIGILQEPVQLSNELRAITTTLGAE